MSEATGIIREHMHDTRCFVLASSPNALVIQQDLAGPAFRVRRTPRPVGRIVLPLAFSDLPTLGMGGSWLLVALIETVAELEATARWAIAARTGAERLHVFFNPRIELSAVLGSWPAPQLGAMTAEFWQPLPGFRRTIGERINAQIVADFGTPGPS